MQLKNNLFPVFFKLEHLHVLIVGGGHIGLEKVSAVLNNSPLSKVTLVAKKVSPEIKAYQDVSPYLIIKEKAFEVNDLDGKDLVIAATGDRAISELIRKEATKRKILINVADTPDLCDFYLGSIVQKGDLKIAISTNGKSPTLAKRLKEVFNESLPEETQHSIENLNALRNYLKGDFSDKVKQLNEITDILVSNKNVKTLEKKWKRIATFSLIGFALLLIGNIIAAYYPLPSIINEFKYLTSQIDTTFYLMILGGFLAQIVDGLLGMGYGVTSTTFLLTMGINPASVSSSVHTAEIFASGASGYSHYKFGNVNKKLFKKLLIPGIIGAILGAFLLSKLGEQYGNYIKPIVGLYTLFLGIRILSKAFKKKKATEKLKRVGWLAGLGGFLDSFGGGGWGPIVTSTLIAKGKNPKYTIGTVSLTEFFVTLTSAFTFFALIGVAHWQVIAGLIIGGLVAAPLAAKLSGKLPLKTMLISVGILIVIVSVRILILSITKII